MVMQVFFVRETIRGGDRRVLLQKEPCAKQVVVESKELFLEVDTNGEEGGLVVDVEPNHNIVQPYSGQGEEEVLVVEIECVDAELLMRQVDYDYEVEGDDQK
ncbi:unnamed protein product [Sphagnum tenellum]